MVVAEKPTEAFILNGFIRNLNRTNRGLLVFELVIIRAGGSVFRGGAKKYSPYVYPPIFRGGPGVARCILRVTGVSRGMTGVSFFSNKQKKVRCIF